MVAIGATLGLIVLLKLRFFACAGGNPSGHTAAAAAVYGGLAGLIIGAIRKDTRWAVGWAIVVGAALALVIGQSRLMLDKHSLAEVVVGGAIGIGGAAGFVGFAGTPARAIRIARIVAVGLVLVLLLHGVRMSAEETIKWMASHFWPSSQCL
jgi:membrane-associated phospholipid phosphatase